MINSIYVIKSLYLAIVNVISLLLLLIVKCYQNSRYIRVSQTINCETTVSFSVEKTYHFISNTILQLILCEGQFSLHNIKSEREKEKCSFGYSFVLLIQHPIKSAVGFYVGSDIYFISFDGHFCQYLNSLLA